MHCINRIMYPFRWRCIIYVSLRVARPHLLRYQWREYNKAVRQTQDKRDNMLQHAVTGLSKMADVLHDQVVSAKRRRR